MTGPAITAPLAAEAMPGWSDLLSGSNLIRALALSGGVALHAVNLYISTTILPSVVREIGGVEYYAWNTTVFVVASILGAALSARLLGQIGPRAGYATAALIFAIGALVCATAPSMAIMLVGRFGQGLGGGLLLALPYALIRQLFAKPLWPRALALLSSMWGIATLLGPAIGGVFAELGIWRLAFWSLIPAAVLSAFAAAFVLPRELDEKDKAEQLPLRQLGLLMLAVLAASCGSVGSDLLLTIGGIAVAVALIVLIINVEIGAPQRLLPHGTFGRASSLGALYMMTALLAMTVTCTEIFLPLFLQDLHAQSPLEAGYIAAVMSAGWTAGAIYTSGLQSCRRDRAMRAGPLLSLLAMGALALLMPWTGVAGDWMPLALICLALIVGGVGVGLAYPHLSADVLQVAPAEEADKAASAIMTVQLCATAFGAALAGLVVNLAGAGVEGGELNTANAARWLFAAVALAPLLCVRLVSKGAATA